MLESAAPRSSDKTPPNLGDLLEDALHQAKTLVQAELSLAKGELASELNELYGSLLLLGVGAIFLQAALATLGVLLVLAFGVGVAATAVVVVLAIVGGVFALLALRSLQKKKLPRTSSRLALDAKQVLETVK